MPTAASSTSAPSTSALAPRGRGPRGRRRGAPPALPRLPGPAPVRVRLDAGGVRAADRGRRDPARPPGPRRLRRRPATGRAAAAALRLRRLPAARGHVGGGLRRRTRAPRPRARRDPPAQPHHRRPGCPVARSAQHRLADPGLAAARVHGVRIGTRPPVDRAGRGRPLAAGGHGPRPGRGLDRRGGTPPPARAHPGAGPGGEPRRGGRRAPGLRRARQGARRAPDRLAGGGGGGRVFRALAAHGGRRAGDPGRGRRPRGGARPPRGPAYSP